LRTDLAASPMCRRVAGMWIRASPNHRKVMKAEQGRQKAYSTASVFNSQMKL